MRSARLSKLTMSQLMACLARFGQLPACLARFGQLPACLARFGHLPACLARLGQLPVSLARLSRLVVRRAPPWPCRAVPPRKCVRDSPGIVANNARWRTRLPPVELSLFPRNPPDFPVARPPRQLPSDPGPAESLAFPSVPAALCVGGGDDIIGGRRFGQDGMRDALFGHDDRPCELTDEIAGERQADSE